MGHVPRSCVVETPADLAVSMATALGANKKDTWLEPCVGKGALLRAVASLGVTRSAVRGLDISKRPHESDSLARVLRGVDFLEWSQRTDERFTRIIANPPYVRIARMPKRIREAADGLTDLSGIHVAPHANCWYAFLCASMGLLAPAGSLCFVLPAAWDFAAYATKLRRRLGSRFGSVDVFRSREHLFTGVRDGRIVLIAREFGGAPTAVRRRRLANRIGLIDALSRSRELSRQPSSEHLGTSRRPVARRSARAPSVLVGDVFAVDIGIVTGQVEYFLMTDDERRIRGLPKTAMLPVVSRARQLNVAALSRPAWERMRSSNERVWLFAPPPRFDSHPAVMAYKRWGSVDGHCDLKRLKIRDRDVWYRPRSHDRADGFLSGMSHRGPWLAVCEMPELRATNTLYVVRAHRDEDRESRYAWALAFLSSMARRSTMRRGRRYAEGLLKWEPGDVAAIRLPRPPEKPAARSTYSTVIRSLLAGELRDAVSAADRWLTSSTGSR